MCLLRIYTSCVNASTKYTKVPVVKGSILAIEDNFSALFKDKFEHQSIIFITTEIKFSSHFTKQRLFSHSHFLYIKIKYFKFFKKETEKFGFFGTRFPRKYNYEIPVIIVDLKPSSRQI